MKFIPFTDEWSEQNDCTVRALSTAVNISYCEAYVKAARLGRKTGRAFSFTKIANCYKFKLMPQFHGITVNQFLHQIRSSGTYVIRVPRHVFTVKDGNIYDYQFRGKRRITHCWLVSGNPPEILTMEIDF